MKDTVRNMSIPVARGERSRSAAAPKQDTVANLLVKYLEARGVKHVFGLCGHTNIAVLAALEKSRKIRFVNTRHEQVAAHMADGYARASGGTSVLLTHLSPGLTNAATGVANAALDSIPMVVIAGDVPTHYYGKHPHQEVNLHADASQFEIYRPFVKRAWRVDSAHLFPEIIEKAFALAESGRPGPVLVDVPMDIFSKQVDVASFERLRLNTKSIARPALDEPTATAIVKNLLSAKRPVLYVGRRDHARRRHEGAARVRRPPADPGRAHADGQGRAARRSSARARHDGLLGHEVHQRAVPRRGLDPGPRHALLRGRLQLVGARVHVQLPADEADARRHRPCPRSAATIRSRSARWPT